jgi:neutral trehalase
MSNGRTVSVHQLAWGLHERRLSDRICHMIDNFGQLIDNFGHISAGG